jgi:hypothetical protein
VNFGIEQGKRFLGTPDRVHGVTEASEEPFGRKPAIVYIINEQNGRVRNGRFFWRSHGQILRLLALARDWVFKYQPYSRRTGLVSIQVWDKLRR